MNPENQEQRQLIPESEITERFSRASGAGGQNVNKVSTKVELRWNVDRSNVFSEEEKTRIKEVLAHRINQGGELLVVVQKERSQLRNREIAYERLCDLVGSALVVPEQRIRTKPTASSTEKRIIEKKRRGEKKRKRMKPSIEE